MKTKNKFIISIIAIMLSCVIMFTAIAVYGNTNKVGAVSASTRTVQLSQSGVDVQSVFDEFEDVELKTEGSLTSFTGYQTLDEELLKELDLIGQTNIDEGSNKRVCYKSSYDTDNGIVTLTAVLEGNSGINDSETLVDVIEGILIIDENGNFDAIFDCDGTPVLLSEMVNAGVVEECGFFSRLWSSVKKVWNTTAGKIGTIITVAACAAVGVICAVVPGGQLLTATCIGVAVGAIGAATTASIASLEDNSIDWKDILCFTGVGAIVGGATAAAAFKLTTAIKNLFPKATPSNDIKCFDSYSKFKQQYGKASDYVNKGEWHHIVEQQTVKNGINPANSVYNTKNTVAISKDLHTQISRYYSSYNAEYGMTFRKYINTLPYEQQYAKGLEILKMFAEKMGGTIIWL